MAEKVGDAFVEISADNRKLKSGLAAGKTEVKNFAAFGARTTAGATHQVAQLRTALGLFRFLTTGLFMGLLARDIKTVAGEAIKGENAIVKLRAVMKATGNASGFTTRQLKEFSSELQTASTYGDDVTQNMMAILATFKNIKGDVFKQASVSILDMANVMDQDLKSGAIQVGKALNDPIEGITALSRVGVQFSDTQKKMIENLQKSGDLMGAQKIILAELKSQFGGAALAARDTFGGALKALGNDFSDLREEQGRMVGELINGRKEIGDYAQSIRSLSGIISSGEMGLNFINEMKGISSAILAGIIFPFEAAWKVVKQFFSNMGTGLGFLLEALNQVAEGNFKLANDALNAMTQMPTLADAVKKAWENATTTIDAAAEATAKRRQEISDAYLGDNEMNNKLNEGLKEGNDLLKEREQIGKSFADIVRFSQQAANVGIGGAGGAGGGGGAVAGGGGGAAAAATATGSIFGLMLAELKKQTAAIEKMAVFA